MSTPRRNVARIAVGIIAAGLVALPAAPALAQSPGGYTLYADPGAPNSGSWLYGGSSGVTIPVYGNAWTQDPRTTAGTGDDLIYGNLAGLYGSPGRVAQVVVPVPVARAPVAPAAPARVAPAAPAPAPVGIENVGNTVDTWFTGLPSSFSFRFQPWATGQVEGLTAGVLGDVANEDPFLATILDEEGISSAVGELAGRGINDLYAQNPGLNRWLDGAGGVSTIMQAIGIF